MRDSILHALFRVLDLLPWTRRRKPGRHSAAHLDHDPVHPVPDEVPYSAWAKPWPGISSRQARAVFLADAALDLTPDQRERRWAAAFAELGVDYPYAYPGDHFSAAG
ncbi:hypothetical protein GT204_30950 [Streptomyces sp. SID4919]|uniref:hypothetical protein n=1 Tax=Streptomyces sp. SID4919 TaxID=2690270 RepID=UPI000823C777|nr:hypothetical protein [Streptomyces sp. SID4919]MYY13184.1 hypothetical protein [Streptomyces sp. SID4919]SCK38364.1 hypothetical protein YW7DRAFT_03252 [Streptomyces sp. AmelKG-E11A]